jgi:hypothetical protein
MTGQIIERRNTKSMQTKCHYCQGELEPAYLVVTVKNGVAEPFVTQSVWADTSLGRIGICNLCYERGKFDGLTTDDIATLHYHFGNPYYEDEDVADYQVSLARLRLSFELSPCPQVEGALGYAYWKLGQNDSAVRHCLSSVSQQPNHFGASKAFHVLRREYGGFRRFAEQLKAKGRRVKSVAEEFPGQRIKKPKK